jgi:hypothetical protein
MSLIYFPLISSWNMCIFSFAEALTMSDFLHDAQSRYVTERIRQHEQREQELQLRQVFVDFYSC